MIFGLLDALVRWMLEAAPVPAGPHPVRPGRGTPADLAGAAAALGLSMSLGEATGTVDGRAVTLRARTEARLELTVETGAGLQVRRGPADADAVHSGDAAFEQAVRVGAEAGARFPGVAVSAFGAPMRAELAALAGSGATHFDGRWRWVVPLDDAAGVVAAVRRLLAIPPLWPTDVVGALVGAITSDPEPGVRALAADRLVSWLEQQPPDPAVVAVVASVVTRPDLVTRLRALSP